MFLTVYECERQYFAGVIPRKHVPALFFQFRVAGNLVEGVEGTRSERFRGFHFLENNFSIPHRKQIFSQCFPFKILAFRMAIRICFLCVVEILSSSGMQVQRVRESPRCRHFLRYFFESFFDTFRSALNALGASAAPQRPPVYRKESSVLPGLRSQ